LEQIEISSDNIINLKIIVILMIDFQYKTAAVMIDRDPEGEKLDLIYFLDRAALLKFSIVYFSGADLLL
jgi:hypothetical protein